MYFPLIYPHELLYSAIARCRVHLGLENHKTLLNILFSDNKVAAITDLPTHLKVFCERVDLYDSNNLIADHTLLPLYAPFITEERKDSLLLTMKGKRGEGILGIVGAIKRLVKWPSCLRFCPACFDEGRASRVEYYWDRRWQILGSDICIKHECYLLNTNVPFRRKERHEYIAATPSICLSQGQNETVSSKELQISEKINRLFTLRLSRSPTYWQWTCFYKELASLHMANKGAHIDTALLWQKVSLYQTKLSFNSLLGSNDASPPLWFIKIFQKHRNSFSYLQHILLWCCLISQAEITHIFEKVLSYPKAQAHQSPVKTQLAFDNKTLQAKRSAWLKHLSLFKGQGVKQARLNGGGAMYAWLYRHDLDWLLKENMKHMLPRNNHSNTDWKGRDQELSKTLHDIKAVNDLDVMAPRKSKQWYLNKLPHSVSVRHHLSMLPLCCEFLNAHAESVGDYQIRRLKRQVEKDKADGNKYQVWQLMRLCGLEKKRLTKEASDYIISLQRI